MNLQQSLRPHLASSIIALAFITAAPTAVASEDWIDLFNGKDLSGWVVLGGQATYAVVDGAIVGSNGPGHNTDLCTEREFANFELQIEVKLSDALNSGIQIRSAARDEILDGNPIKRIHGPQVEIELSPAEAGYLYGERAGGWMTPADKLIPHSHFKNGEWNRYRIVAEGPRIRTWINDALISDLVHDEIYTKYPSGFIGLQVHQSKGEPGTFKVAWRNIRIRELPAS
ncbi:MAG TPA: DUF1080 domain-containing protein [Opitutaceae bacterium]|nr:DUF1080 domain-containing protein [Opitutaceae bacterium]